MSSTFEGLVVFMSEWDLVYNLSNNITIHAWYRIWEKLKLQGPERKKSDMELILGDSGQTVPQLVLMYKRLRFEFTITEKGAVEKQHEQSFSFW